jgi:hypothetical protein
MHDIIVRLVNLVDRTLVFDVPAPTRLADAAEQLVALRPPARARLSPVGPSSAEPTRP